MKIKTKIRQAEIKDILDILKIEKEAWGGGCGKFDKKTGIIYLKLSQSRVFLGVEK